MPSRPPGPPRTPSDYGELLAAYSKQGEDLKKLQSRMGAPKLIAIGTLIVGLANAQGFVEIVKGSPPAATKADIEALRADIRGLRDEVGSIRDYERQKHHADEKWRRVVASGLDRLGFRVRGIESDAVKWQSTNAKASTWEAAERDGSELAVEYPLAP